ncbi:MAG: PelD GGDEF domain-containing protein [Burkholderiales bacterium]|nr:PelD GGDEF domain-containing protein [Burkholderiales bacterium]
MTGNLSQLVRRARRAAARALPRLEGPWIWVEVLVLTGAVLGLGLAFSPEDPLFVAAEFPWAWFAPVLLALRYGVVAGLASSALLLGYWYWSTPATTAFAPPKLYFLGGLLLVMIAGEYSGIWRMRLRRQSELVEYLEERVERVTNRLYLLRLSHEHLEQDLLARPTTLRDALGELERRVIAVAKDGPLPGARELLAFLAQTAQIEVAALEAVASRDGERRFERVAALGEPAPLAPDDPLLAHMEERGELAHVQSAALDRSVPTPHLVVAPVRGEAGALAGVLVVDRMPFFALTDETLQLVAVLLAYYADAVAAAPAVHAVVESHPDVPLDFAAEMVRLARLAREFQVPSHIVAFRFGSHPLWKDAFELVVRSRRGKDVLWTPSAEADQSVVVNLLPVAGIAAVDGYLLRIDGALKESFGAGLAGLGIQTLTIPLTDRAPLATLARWRGRKR